MKVFKKITATFLIISLIVAPLSLLPLATKEVGAATSDELENASRWTYDMLTKSLDKAKAGGKANSSKYAEIKKWADKADKDYRNQDNAQDRTNGKRLLNQKPLSPSTM